MKPSYIFLTTDFEEIEAIATIDVLRRAGLNVVTVSVESSKQVEGSHGVVVTADTLLEASCAARFLASASIDPVMPKASLPFWEPATH